MIPRARVYAAAPATRRSSAMATQIESDERVIRLGVPAVSADEPTALGTTLVAALEQALEAARRLLRALENAEEQRPRTDQDRASGRSTCDGPGARPVLAWPSPCHQSTAATLRIGPAPAFEM